MKSLIICAIALLTTATAFSQNTTKNSSADTTKQTIYACTMHPDYISFAAAKCPVCGNEMSQKEVIKMEIARLYTCPMDNIICTKPGKCPKCGMKMEAYHPKKS